MRVTIRRGILDGLFIIENQPNNDERGFFLETARMDELQTAVGAPISFVQINHSHSSRGVLRGLHAEDWEKLVYVPHGDVLTAVADVRPGSPTFGQVETFQLGDQNRRMIYIPRRMAHGWYAISDEADYIYQVTRYYDGTDNLAVAWDDPDLAVPWPSRDPILSVKDQSNPRLRDLFPDLVPSAARPA